MLIHHFGHAVLECLSRLWFVVESGAGERIAFLPMENYDPIALKTRYKDFFELLGIDLKRVIYMEEPAQFDRVIVPEETVHSQSTYNEKYTVIYEKMMENVKAKDAKKVYLTRTQLENADCLNEEYFEEFYKRRGYAIIAPEKLKLSDQIAYMKGAEEIACTMGTLSHLALFSRPGTKVAVLVRGEEGSPLTEQIMVCQAKSLDFYFVDVSCGFLPIKHHIRPFLLGPSMHWKEYLDATKEEYAEGELEWDRNRWAYEYLQKWCEAASTLDGWKFFRSFDNFDVLNSLSTVLLGAPLKREDYPGSFKENEAALLADNERLKAAITDPGTERLETEIEKLQKENKALKLEVMEFESSLTWKLVRSLKKNVWFAIDKRVRAKIRAALSKRFE